MTHHELKTQLRERPTLKDFHSGYRLLENAAGRRVKVGVLASFTADFIVPILKTELAITDLQCEIYKPGFNQFRQELLDPSSGLYRFQPDVTIVAFTLEDLVPEVIGRFPILSTEERDAAMQQVLTMCESLVQQFRSISDKGIVLIQDLAVPDHVYAPLVRSTSGLQTFVRLLNERLHDLSQRFSNTYIMDYASLVSERGSGRWTDPRTYFTARIALGQEHWIALAQMYGRYIRAALNLEVKCIVLDLDNTLWGGVLGEDGFDGIAIGDQYPGNVFRRFQEYLLGMYADGYVLAISSKNDLGDVLDVLRRHPGMLLKEEHFAAVKANWNSKEDNIREISKEIQISYDHMLFVDDNAIEIEKVRAAVPGIHCLYLASPPLHYKQQFEQMRCIGKLLVTDEDRKRGQQYSEDRRRREHREQLGSINDFYRSLGQRLTVYINHRAHRGRIAQLAQRTNQFNMTTARLTEADVERLMDMPDHMLITADLEDRFGQNGTIGVMLVRKLERSWAIENLLLSCRVLGRTVEERLMDLIVELARSSEIENIFATFIPTKKNAPFAEFYPRNGFTEVETQASGEKRYAVRVSEFQTRESFIEIVWGE